MQMTSHRQITALVINLLLAIGLIAIWVTFAPTRLGGKVAYVMVNGISMEPHFHYGDLTILRKADWYEVGDIVTYYDSDMHAYVIHRIIATEGNHYVLQGDNNFWIDAYRPTNEEIIGKLWMHIPKIGNVFKWLHAPLHMAISVGLLGGFLMASLVVKPGKPGKTKGHPQGISAGTLEIGIYLFGCFTVLFLVLSILAFLKPLTRAGESSRYQQETHFSYSAAGTPLIYDTGSVRSGEPVFPRLTCFLNIAFTYNLTGDQLQAVSGNYQLVARVSDEQSGWQRTIPMNERTPFSGNSFSSTSNLDLCQIVSLVDTLREETGLRASNFTLEIIPQITMTAYIMGNPVTDLFEPQLAFRFDEVHFSLAVPQGQDDPLFVSKEGAADNPDVQPNSLSLFGWHAEIGMLRTITLLGLALSLSGLAFFGFRMFGAARHSQEAVIRMKYGTLLVNVYERNLAPTSMVIDVTTIDELAKLAERHNTVILHMALNFVHYYMVQCHGFTYRYVFSAGRRGIPEIDSPPQQFIHYGSGLDENVMTVSQLNENELFNYVIQNNPVPTTALPDKVILKKIQL
jgi:signal peptidase